MCNNLLNSIFQYMTQIKEEWVIFRSDESFSICQYDVDIILGLKDKGTTVQLDGHITPQDVPKKYKVSYAREHMQIDDMVDIMYSDGPLNEHFDRCLFLLLGHLTCSRNS